MSGKTLGKGGKPKVTHNKAGSAALERISATVEEMQAALMAKGEAVSAVRITEINGVDKDGQFYVTVNTGCGGGGGARADATRRVVIPPAFLKNPGEKKAKISCPELIKVGAAIFYNWRSGDLVASRQICHVGRWSGEIVHNHIYADLSAVLSEEKEREWAIRGILKV
jgi:hypothetical protein